VGPTEQKFEAVLLMNAEGKSGAPTVVTPHGGPHSAFPAVYMLSNAYLNLLGYNVIQVNFRCFPTPNAPPSPPPRGEQRLPQPAGLRRHPGQLQVLPTPNGPTNIDPPPPNPPSHRL